MFATSWVLHTSQNALQADKLASYNISEDPELLEAAGHGFDQAVPALCLQRSVWSNWKSESQHLICDPPRWGERTLRRRGCMRTRLHLGCTKRRKGGMMWILPKEDRTVLILQGQKHEVTFLCPSPDGIHIAVGYEDGAVRVFSLLNGESNVSFNGHKSAVTVIRYDTLGARLVTG
ncbi:hypothetical protein LDENG_00134880, partial [Lucifuga dentata]